MAAMTETQVAATELEKLDAVLPDLFEVEDTFFSQIEKKNVQVISYREMRVPMKIWPGGKPGHFDSTSSNTTTGLGRGSGPKWAYAAISPVTTRHAIEWDLKSEWATDDRRKAVVNAVRETVAEAMSEYRRFLDCLAMTAGNGILATISSAANNTPTGYDRYTCDSEYGVRLLRYNHDITIYQANLSAVRHADVTEKEIVNIDYANKTFDCVTVTNLGQATDVVLPSGLSGATPTSFWGVGYHASSASTGTWEGLDRATYPQIRANSVNAAGALSLTHARLAMNKIGERLGQDKMKKMVAWMHPCQVQAYEEMGQLVQVINRTGGSPQGLDMYFDVQQIAGAPIRKHFSWSKKRIDFMDMSLWGRAEVAPIQWFKTEGRRIHNIYASGGGLAPIFGSYIVSAFNYFHENPATLSYIYGLTIPSGY
jgi:hypothetical protein